MDWYTAWVFSQSKREGDDDIKEKRVGSGLCCLTVPGGVEWNMLLC